MIDRPLRTFVAIELPDNVRAALANAQDELRRVIKEGGRSVRWTDPVSSHLTLKFLGATPAAAVPGIHAALRGALADASPVQLTTGALGGFPTIRAPRVLWLGLDGALAELAALRDAVEAAICPLGWPTEARPFQPHLTLGRLRPDAAVPERVGVGKALGAIWPPPSVTLIVEAVSLMRSELGPTGARYTRLAEFPITPS